MLRFVAVPKKYVFSIVVSSQRYVSGSRSFYHQAKIERKTLVPTVFWLLYDFLSLKIDVNVPSKSTKQNNLRSWRSLMKIAGFGSRSLVRGMDQRIGIRIRIRTKISWICNTGFFFLYAIKSSYILPCNV